ncbi:MAG: hypothetical protein QOI62_580 [Solirubrobacteraceae bacterium]|nr:hypothetical protein [Solirubrobacteraceae bacterium]
MAADSTTPRAPHRGRSLSRALDAAIEKGTAGTLPEDTKHPKWEEQPDGSRTRKVNGIRIVDRTTAADRDDAAIEHLIAEDEQDGRVRIVGLDAACRPVYVTTLFGYL